MDLAIIWLVVWLVGGIVGSWGASIAAFLSFAYAVAEESGIAFIASILLWIIAAGWTILWIINTIFQIISVVGFATA